MSQILERRAPIIIAVDGPAGSGKSSICSEVCRRLGFTYVNTGLIYRAFGLFLKESQLDFNSPQAIRFALDSFTKAVSWDPEEARIRLNGIDLSDQLSTNEAGQLASKIAALPEVREVLKPVQRQWAIAANKGAVVDGRDIGTTIFPDANLKVFLTASLEKRAERRLNQLLALEGESSKNWSLGIIQKEIACRDEADSTRSNSPLAKAQDAVILDTSDLTKEETIERMLRLIKGVYGS